MLTFHGVASHLEDRRIERNHHTVDEFAALARLLRENFDVLPLSAIGEVLPRPEGYPRAVFLTSDDGYRNVLTHAADILDSFRLPWTLFISTRHIGSEEPNPLFLARLFLYFAPPGRYAIPHLSRSMELGGSRGAMADVAIRQLMGLPAPHAHEAIAAMVSALSPSCLAALRARFSSERFLDWADVNALAARGVEIGAHAHWHWPMNEVQSPSDITAQAQTSRRMVVRHVGECRHFAYPFGNIHDVCREAWCAVRDAGFAHAFTTLSATLAAGSNPWLLPRYTLAAREDNLPALLALLRTGTARLARWQKRLTS